MTPLQASFRRYKLLKRELTKKQHELDEALTDLVCKAGTVPSEGRTPLPEVDDTRGTLVFKLNRKVDPAVVARLGNRVDVDKFFAPKYELRIKAYRNATDEERQVLAEAITTTPAKPSVEIKEC